MSLTQAADEARRLQEEPEAMEAIRAGDSSAFELRGDQLRIQRAVLQHQNLQGAHGVAT